MKLIVDFVHILKLCIFFTWYITLTHLCITFWCKWPSWVDASFNLNSSSSSLHGNIRSMDILLSGSIWFHCFYLTQMLSVCFITKIKPLLHYFTCILSSFSAAIEIQYKPRKHVSHFTDFGGILSQWLLTLWLVIVTDLQLDWLQSPVTKYLLL